MRRHPDCSDAWHRWQLVKWEASETEAWKTGPADSDTPVHRYRALLLRWAIDQIPGEEVS